MLANFAGQLRQLLREDFVSNKTLPDPYERANDLNARAYVGRAFQDVRQHHCTMLREYIGRIFEILAALQIDEAENGDAEAVVPVLEAAANG